MEWRDMNYLKNLLKRLDKAKTYYKSRDIWPFLAQKWSDVSNFLTR